jgi:hypothetical protein
LPFGPGDQRSSPDAAVTRQLDDMEKRDGSPGNHRQASAKPANAAQPAPEPASSVTALQRQIVDLSKSVERLNYQDAAKKKLGM